MLELRSDEKDSSLSELLWKRGRDQGRLAGMTETCCRLYRGVQTNKNYEILKIFNPDEIEELNKFYDRYGSVSDEKRRNIC